MAESSERVGGSVKTESEIRDWMVNKIAETLQVPPAEIASDEPLVAIGLDSMQFVVLVGELEEWLGAKFADNPLIDYPTIDALAAFLGKQLALGKATIDPANPD